MPSPSPYQRSFTNNSALFSSSNCFNDVQCGKKRRFWFPNSSRSPLKRTPTPHDLHHDDLVWTGIAASYVLCSEQRKHDTSFRVVTIVNLESTFANIKLSKYRRMNPWKHIEIRDAYLSSSHLSNLKVESLEVPRKFLRFAYGCQYQTILPRFHDFKSLSIVLDHDSGKKNQILKFMQRWCIAPRSRF